MQPKKIVGRLYLSFSKDFENLKEIWKISKTFVRFTRFAFFFFFSYVRTSQVIKIVKNETGLAREEFTIRFIEAFEFLTCNIWYKVSSYRKMISICYMQSR